MKKIYLIIISFLIVTLMVAQTPANRSVQTVIADALSQMPAAKQADYNKTIAELISIGENGVIELAGMLSPGKEGNQQVEYALSAMSHFVMSEGKEEARLKLSNGYMSALKQAKLDENKDFLIRQLQIVGKDEAVDTLSSFIKDEYTSGPATRALASIGSVKAVQGLVDALNGQLSSDATQHVILALGEVGMKADATLEIQLQGYLASDDENIRKVAFFTLSRVGTVNSIKILANAASQTGYGVENSGSNEAYIYLLKKLAAEGHSKDVEKVVTDLLKKTAKSGQNYTRISALEILLDIQKNAGSKLLLEALKDPCIEYRNAALNAVADFADDPLYITVLRNMAKAKSEVQADILNWVGREAACPDKNERLTKLDTGKGELVPAVVRGYLQSSVFDVKQSAAWALVALNDVNSLPSLAALLQSGDAQTILLGKNTLASFNGNISEEVAKVIPVVDNAGKVAAIELLAARKATPYFSLVVDQTKNASPEVSDASYNALKDLATNKDLDQISAMLESSNEKNTKALQQAVISAVSSYPPSEQINIVKGKMERAGDKTALYYIVLASLNNKDVLPLIVDGFTKGNATSRKSAFDALVSWKSLDVAEDLFVIASDPSFADYSTQALDAFVRLVAGSALTGENRFLKLREAMEIATTDKQKNTILNNIGKTNTFPALMYAGGYLEEKALQQSAAQAVMNIALANPQYNGKNVRALLEKVIVVLDNPDADYQRQAIRKYLAENPDEDGFVSIFNGQDLSGWKGLVKNPILRAKMSRSQLEKEQKGADEQMRKDWKVEDRLLVFDGTGYDNICTVKQYGDIEMYVDWKLDPDGPEPDAGIYLRGTPQVQVWDISRVNVGAQVGSGGLYNNKVHESKPLKVADNKLGEWNTFYIKMTGDRVTVKLNGELVTDDIILENYWDRKQPIFPMEQIELQAHGSKVYYRDIYVKELKTPDPFVLSDEEKKEGYKILFDGTNMHQWVGNTVDYTLEEGTISMIPSKKYGGNLYTKEEYGDFTIRFEFQLTPAANNGLGIRTPMEGDAAYVGMELQILDSEHPVYKNLHDYQYHGSVYGIIPAKRGFLKPVGEWNYQEVIAKGDHIKITLNGEVILDGNIRDAVKNGTPDGKQHPGLFNKKGHIAFLGHGSPVKFRNIRIKVLD